MSLRIAAAASLVMGATILFGFFYWIGETPISAGPERHLRDMKERTAAPRHYTSYTFADFAALPHGRAVAEFAALEGRGVSLEGYAFFTHQSTDGDYHMSLTPRLPKTWPADSARITAELTPQWQRGSSTWQWEPLLTALGSYGRGMDVWPKGPRRVRVSGWLMYDFQYDEHFLHDRRPHLLAQTPGRLTGWEIHPVTRLELWDDSLHAFVDYPR